MPTSLARRFGAITYDSLLVLALMCLATLPFVALRRGEFVEPGNPVHQLALVLVAYAFFAGFWAGAGRTLGMQCWGLRLENADGSRPDLRRATLRFFAAILSWLPAGLGFWWQLRDAERLCWHDRLSGTRLKYCPRPT